MLSILYFGFRLNYHHIVLNKIFVIAYNRRGLISTDWVCTRDVMNSRWIPYRRQKGKASCSKPATWFIFFQVKWDKQCIPSEEDVLWRWMGYSIMFLCAFTIQVWDFVLVLWAFHRLWKLWGILSGSAIFVIERRWLSCYINVQFG